MADRLLGYHLYTPANEQLPRLEIRVREDGERRKSRTHNLKDVGFGLSQVLPLLVQCYLGPANRTIILEQPELHLHPRAQADLGDLLIDAMKKGHRFIVETHSEHLLLRLRRRIAETAAQQSSELKLGHDQLGVYFVERHDGRSVASPVDIDETGQFVAEPDGFRDFFSDDYEEVMKITLAAARRNQMKLAR